MLVGMGNPEESEQFRREMKIDFPLVCDEEKNIYVIYALKRSTPIKMASLKLFIKGIKALVEGHKLSTPKHDPFQLSGVFLIDIDGTIAWTHYAKDPSDDPPVEKVLQAWRNAGT